MQIVRYMTAAEQPAVGLLFKGQVIADFPTPGAQLQTLFRLRLDELHTLAQQSLTTSAGDESLSNASLLAPIDGETEVWASGVTYKRSMHARMEESETPDIYSRVYVSERPELFYKGNLRRTSGPDAPVVVRGDSEWDVPEPELALAINAYGEIIGYTVANDVSSRSIEGENPLYLPQAKVYARSCALGPGITPAWEIADPYDLTIRMEIEREGQTCWEGETSTNQLNRRLEDLVSYLFREDDFPSGVILCTGTGLVPDPPFTLTGGDVVRITIDHLGTLSTPVVRGKAALQPTL